MYYKIIQLLNGSLSLCVGVSSNNHSSFYVSLATYKQLHRNFVCNSMLNKPLSIAVVPKGGNIAPCGRYSLKEGRKYVTYLREFDDVV